MGPAGSSTFKPPVDRAQAAIDGGVTVKAAGGGSRQSAYAAARSLLWLDGRPARWRPGSYRRPGGGLVACKRAKVIGPARSVPRDRRKDSGGVPFADHAPHQCADHAPRPAEGTAAGPQAGVKRLGSAGGNRKRPDGGPPAGGRVRRRKSLWPCFGPSQNPYGGRPGWFNPCSLLRSCPAALSPWQGRPLRHGASGGWRA